MDKEGKAQTEKLVKRNAKREKVGNKVRII